MLRLICRVFSLMGTPFVCGRFCGMLASCLSFMVRSVFLELFGFLEFVTFTGNAGESDGHEQQGEKFHGGAT